jgi:hypothetical protein
MASAGTVEIDVELKGTQDIKDGFKSISQAGKSLAQSVGSTNEKLAEGLGEVGESVFSFADSLGELKGSLSGLGQAGGAGFSALLGPIGAVTVAAFGLYEVFKLVSGSALEAEENQSAMSAAAADLQGKLEALAEKGVVLAADEMQRFTKMTLLAQVAKEKLQFSQEKLTKTTINYIKAEEDLKKAQEFVNKVQARQIVNAQELEGAYVSLRFAKQQLTATENAFNNAIQRGLKEQSEVSKKIAEAEKKYKSYEETSAEFLSTKIKENLERKKTLQLAQAEATSTDKQFKLKKIEIEQATTLSKLQAEKNKDDQKALLAQHKNIEDELKGLNEVEIANKKAAFQRKQLAKAEAAKAKAERQKRDNEAKQRAAREVAAAKMREQQQLKLIAEEARIKQLEIELTEDSTQKQINLATHRYVTQLKLAKDNQNLQRIAILQFENEITSIQTREALERENKRRELVKQAQEFSLDNALFNAQQIENSFERENELLRLNYEKQILQAEGNQQQINELTRRYAIERVNLVKQETAETDQALSSFFGNMGRGLAEVAVNSILMGESFKKGIASLLMSLSKQAGVEALMETAKGVAASFLTPALAANHFKAAGIFGAAALAAGGAGVALGGGASGTASAGGGGAGAMMGSAQTAPPIQREEATSSELVFNVNFSGAVIYDTKKAAEQALADRVTKVMNERRRGSPRRRNS